MGEQARTQIKVWGLVSHCLAAVVVDEVYKDQFPPRHVYLVAKRAGGNLDEASGQASKHADDALALRFFRAENSVSHTLQPRDPL